MPTRRELLSAGAALAVAGALSAADEKPRRFDVH
ncbi:MAG: twin-arginine translocation signal domain-containing protein [Planctomycetes bacterium]|nr:twin-arginine translocation signal domain-containing protein [Planctomycetota bacterium]